MAKFSKQLGITTKHNVTKAMFVRTYEEGKLPVVDVVDLEHIMRHATTHEILASTTVAMCVVCVGLLWQWCRLPLGPLAGQVCSSPRAPRRPYSSACSSAVATTPCPPHTRLAIARGVRVMRCRGHWLDHDADGLFVETVAGWVCTCWS